ncbi:hypothetical protein GGG16DRAFT_84931 [Schizophyllum commune]
MSPQATDAGLSDSVDSRSGSREQLAPPGSSGKLRGSPSNTNLSTHGTAQATPVSVEQLLQANATSPDPVYAAFEQAVNERNTFAGQNAQLWKLIEKQRAGYNQILKELERVRTERDSYKHKLAALTGVDPKRRASSRHAERAHTIDSSDGEHAARHPQIPDDPTTPRTSQQPFTAPRAEDMPRGPRHQTRKSSLPPIRVPPHPDHATVPSSSSISSAGSQQAPYKRAHSDSTASRESNASGSSSIYSRPSGDIPHPTPDKAASVPTSHVGSPVRSHQHHPSNVTVTPQSEPRSQSAPMVPPQAVPSPALTPTQPSSSHLSPFPTPSAMALDPRLASRDSRVSLPDEAKRYIANMADSPMPSPQVNRGAFSPTSSKFTSSPQPRSTSPYRQREFLDLNDDDDDDADSEDEGEDDGNDQNSIATRSTRPEDPVTPQNNAVDPQRQAEIQRQQIAAQRQRQMEEQQRQVEAQRQQIENQRREAQRKARARGPGADDFPLPPGSPSASVHDEQSTTPLRSPHPKSERSGGTADSDESDFERELGSRKGQSMDMQPAFRELPLLPHDLPHTTVNVLQSFIRTNDRGKEVLSFVMALSPGSGKKGWNVEKSYSDVLALDTRIRSRVNKGMGKKIAALPEGKLWKDHAPAKVDQRKRTLQAYLQALINLPVKNNDEVIAFFTTDIVKETRQPIMQVGHKEGYLTKRGKNFGGWKRRYFVLQGPVLEYYDNRGGNHLGSISITGAQIGRQQRTEKTPATDEEKEYRHAFLIVESKRGPGGNHPRHVLCAETDEERDSWVDMLVRYFTGTYSDDPNSYVAAGAPSRPSMSSESVNINSTPRKTPTRGMSSDTISIAKGPAMPLSQLQQDASNAKLFSTPTLEQQRSESPALRSGDQSPEDRPPPQHETPEHHHQQEHREREREQQRAPRKLAKPPPPPSAPPSGQPSSLPDSSPLSAATSFSPEPLVNGGQRATSEMGHYPDMQQERERERDRRHRHHNHHHESPDHPRRRDHDQRKSFHPSVHAPERVPSPDKSALAESARSKISGPMNGAPIPAGFKFGGKDAPSPEVSMSDRREKAKSRSFWNFGRPADKSAIPAVPRNVFGVPLEESLDVAQIANLPAIVFRAIQYLEAKKADQEEGIYRLSGSSAVIKSLKDRFNAEGDVDLLAADDFWDPHAIAGLLKTYLRELPSSILTRELHMRFLAVIDFVDAQERIRELSQLISMLPLANYSLLRALTAHLILVVQNSSVNKMTIRNVGIVFSPTLGIPAGVFSLMLGEFNRVFNVDADNDPMPGEQGEGEGGGDDTIRRNSRQYTDAAADQMLGLSGRTLKSAPEEAPSDGDDFSSHDESGNEQTDGDGETIESTYSSSALHSQNDPAHHLTPPETPTGPRGKAASAAAVRGLNVSIQQSDRGHRHSRLMGMPHGGLPASPRPPASPRQPPPV